MPSRPMLTTPARSDHRPAEAGEADRHGEAERGADLALGGELVGAGDDAVPAETRTSAPAMISRTCAQGELARGVARLDPRLGGGGGRGRVGRDGSCRHLLSRSFGGLGRELGADAAAAGA